MPTRRAFTLIELLVVISIMALLVSILVPSLGAARELAQSAICASNQHGIFLAAALYSSDYEGWLGPTTERFATFAGGTSKLVQRLPDIMLVHPLFGREHLSLLPPDFYYVLGLVEAQRTGDWRTWKGNPKEEIIAGDMLQCPIANSKLGSIYGIYNGAVGRVQCHYFFSALMRCDAAREYGGPTFYQTNTVGPYRPEDLAGPSETLFMGDGLAYEGWPGYGTNGLQVDYAMGRNFRYQYAGIWNRSFGEVTRWGAIITDPYAHYHENTGVNGTYWDGHVENMTPPGNDRPDVLRRQLTRDGTATQADGSLWD